MCKVHNTLGLDLLIVTSSDFRVFLVSNYKCKMNNDIVPTAEKSAFICPASFL